MIRKIALACALLSSTAHAANLDTIYWMTEPKPCNQGDFAGPITSGYYQACTLGNAQHSVQVSICPTVDSGSANSAYNRTLPIQIIGYQINSIIEGDPQASNSVLVGSQAASGSPEQADVFASCSGNGTIHCAEKVSRPFVQGGNPGTDGDHIDVYDTCVSKKPGTTYRLVILLEFVPQQGG